MTSPVSAELQQKIALWRLKTADGTITLEEMKEAVVHLRAGRVAAAVAATAAGRKKKAPADLPKAGDMLDELENL